jgi:hypothetical protein
MTTFLILALVFAGALYLARILILIGAAAYETVAFRRRFRGIASRRIRTLDDVLDLLTVKGWLAPPRRRPSIA